MKMKKMVIEIPEEIHLCIIRDGYFFDNETNIIRQAIKNGTPLPKGHGDLIDVSELLASEKPRGISDEMWKESHIYKLLSNAPVVIEADADTDTVQEMKSKDTKKKEGIEL